MLSGDFPLQPLQNFTKEFFSLAVYMEVVIRSLAFIEK